MARLAIEVVYATRESQRIVPLVLEEGACALDAVHASGLLEQHPELCSGPLRLGIFGEESAHDVMLSDGDRVELYRPLRLDPKEARRARARETRRK